MRKTAFIFAGIMATVIGNAYATGENTVTSKSYVDAMDATKQDAITAGTTGNVVTYNGEDANGQAQFSEKGIYSGAATYSNSDSDKLITAGVVHNMAETLETLTVPDNKLTCYNQNEGCTLWQVSTGTASLAAQGTFAPLTAAAAPLPALVCSGVGENCNGNFDCCGTAYCSTKGKCVACNASNESCGSNAECCSGVCVDGEVSGRCQ